MKSVKDIIEIVVVYFSMSVSIRKLKRRIKMSYRRNELKRGRGYNKDSSSIGIFSCNICMT
jgi:hypothetical protein